MSFDKYNKPLSKCLEVNCLCDKAQYNEAEQWEEQEIAEHLEKCPKCREYSMRNTKLTELCNKAKLQTLKEEEIIELKKILKENLKS